MTAPQLIIALVAGMALLALGAAGMTALQSLAARRNSRQPRRLDGNLPNAGQVTVAASLHPGARGVDASSAGEQSVRIVITDLAGEAGGLGLAAIDSIVTRAGGRFHVDSSGDGRAAFTIDLPLTAEAPVTTGDVSMSGPAPTVLVVEDEPGMREFISLVLGRAGRRVVTVPGPRAALEAINREPAISVMLVDVVMPEMDGYEVVAEARKISPSLHVVFMSAFAPDLARQPVGDSFLAKPFTSESLTSAIEKALAVV